MAKKETQTIIREGTKEYVETKHKSAMAFWVACIVWILAAIFLPMHKLIFVLITAVASVAIGALAGVLTPKKVVREQVKFHSGNADLDAIVNEINTQLEVISAEHAKIARRAGKVANDEIRSDAMKAEKTVGEIESTVEKIREALVDRPQEIPQVRRFMNYYLPIASKLMAKYAEAIAQNTETVNIKALTDSIEAAFETIDTAFKHQLDALFADDKLDVTTDIKVLETMLRKDALLDEDEMPQQTAQAARANEAPSAVPTIDKEFWEDNKWQK